MIGAFSRRSNMEGAQTAAPAIVAFEDVFETDDEGGSDDELSDSSDEETAVNDELDRDIGEGHAPSYVDVASGESSPVKISHDTARSTISPYEQRIRQNKFVNALMNAAESYSTRLRVPTSYPKQLVAPQGSLKDVSQPSDLHDILSDESDESDGENESSSSSDQFDDAERLSDRPSFDSVVAHQLVYHPTNPWAGLKDCPIEDPVVIATLHAGTMCEAFIKEGRLDGRRITYISKMWRLSQKWEGFFSEMALYAAPEYLRPLQGKIVPTVIGLYLVEGAISVAMELPSSDFWIEASEDMSNHLKQRCISAFDRIHERGVLHNDVELRHMLVNSRGDVTIIDFQESRALKPVESVGLKAATEADIRLEKRKIHFKLNFGDGRKKEIEKISRVTKREDRRQEEPINLANRSVESGEDKAHIESDEQSEPEDSDDVVNPAVDSQTWTNDWVGEPFTPTCYIVPGRDQVHVSSAIQEFLEEELDRQEGDQVASMGDLAEISSISFPVSSTMPTPVLPTRIAFKRKRDKSDEASNDSPSTKRRIQILSCTEAGNSISGVGHRAYPSHTDTAPPSDGSADIITPVPSDIPALCRPLVPDVHVPFEGYAEDDGFILANIYSREEIARFRRIWIRQYSIKRSIEDGLPYPVAELDNLVPSTQRRGSYRIDSRGRKKRRRPLRNRGALKRRKIDLEDPDKRTREALERKEEYLRNRKEPGTGLSDSEDEEPKCSNSAGDDGTPEGGRILFWHEFDELAMAGRCSSVYSTPYPCLSPSYAKPMAPTKGILRRQLTPSEKARNVALLEEYKRKYEADSDAETDKESDAQRSAKRARMAPTPPISRTASPSASGGGGVGFERYAGSPNPLTVTRLPNDSMPDPFGTRLPSHLSRRRPGSTITRLLARSSTRVTIPSRVDRDATRNRTSVSRNQHSAVPSASTSTISDALSESEPESDGDQGPLSSVWPPLRKRRHRRSQATSDSNMPPRFVTGITLEELHKPGTNAMQPEENSRGSGTAEQAPAARKAGWPWSGFRFTVPWNWSFFKR